MAELTVRHTEEQGIEIQFQNALAKGFSFDGKQTLVNHSMAITLSDAKAAELLGLVNAYRPQEWIEKHGDHITTEERERYDWILDRVEGDAHGIYRAMVNEGTGPLTMEVAKRDVVSMENNR